MDNYEINILRRGGNWKKVKPNDLLIDEIDNEPEKDNNLNKENLNDSFLSYITKVNTIFLSLETRLINCIGLLELTV